MKHPEQKPISYSNEIKWFIGIVILIGMVLALIWPDIATPKAPELNPQHLCASQDDLAALASQVRELSCEVKGGVYNEPQWINNEVWLTLEWFCTKGGVDYIYQDGKWVNTETNTKTL